MYQIVRITDKEGVAKAGAEGMGCIGEPKMEDGCVLIHCRYDRRGDPCDRYIRTSLVQTRRQAGWWWRQKTVSTIWTR